MIAVSQFMRGIKLVLLIAGLAAGVSVSAASTDEPLRPEVAFRYDVRQAGSDVVVRWDIEPGYYLYRARMSFSSESDALVIGNPVFEAGEAHYDEFFGDMEIYRNQTTVRIPIAELAKSSSRVSLELRSQGCADIGLCYPPQVWTAIIDVDPSAAGGKLGNLLNQRIGGGLHEEPLPVDLAFQPSVTVLDPFNIEIRWFIEAGYYLYRDSLVVSATGTLAQIGPANIPQGTPHFDEHFGDTEVFFDNAVIRIPLARATPAGGVFPLSVDFQGCKADSICYPPQTVSLDVELPVATADDLSRQGQPGEEIISEQDRLSGLIMNGNLIMIMLTFTGLGLLLAFTPCVLPMVPILSGIIAGQGKDVTTSKAFALSLTYVLGMAFTYTLAGAAFGAMGGQIQAALQKPWIIIGVAMLFVALALSMFGLYELQMPAAVQTRLSALSNRQRTGSFVGTAMMGALSALVVTTCVAPPLVASMTVIAQLGDVVRGALALFAMSIGMGIPLLIIGTSAGRWLPKAGAWMDSIKQAFGFMMLALAIWMLERILPGAVTMVLWAILVFMAGVFLGAFQKLDTAAAAPRMIAKGAGVLATLYGAALLLGALNGAENPLQPMRFIDGDRSSTGIEFKRIKTVNDLDLELAEAVDRGRPIMLDFYADWCVSCKEMEHYTFTDETVTSSLADVLLIQADVTANDDADKALLQRFGIFGPPTIIFFDLNGQERRNFRVVGFMPPEEFSNHISKAISGPASSGQIMSKQP
jgi:thiol:disulfide interchange protein DsbD